MSTPPHLSTTWGPNESAAFNDDLEASFTLAPSAKGKRLTFIGKCPYCAGPVNYTVDLELVPSVPGAPVGQGVSELVTVIECTCTEPHPGRPPGTQGCGQRWTTVVEVAK